MKSMSIISIVIAVLKKMHKQQPVTINIYEINLGGRIT